MDWTEQIDIYCERLDFSFWAEPVNALTNLAFIIAAVIMWRRVEGLVLGRVWARVLSAILFAIGCGSFLFHTFATQWAAASDVIPILIFSLTYIYVANRFFWRMPAWLAGLGTLAYFPYSNLVSTVARDLVPALGGTADYVPLPILIFLFGLGLLRRAPATGRGLLFGAGILVISMTARTIDIPLCANWPLGTHFLWHILNAVMLGWMIEVYRRHMATQAEFRNEI